MTAAKHTELPWAGKYGIVRGGDRQVFLVAECGGKTSNVRRANAEYIARSANSHYALVEALQMLRDAAGKLRMHPDDTPGGMVAALCIADDALKQAKGES